MDLRLFLEPQQGATYEQQLTLARLAEDLGFDAFFRSDHFLVMGGFDPLPGPTDSWVTLGAIARETARIRLGTMVTSATFRLPGMLAVQVAQVDEMSGGRVELGLGTGWYEQEHLAYGVPFPPLGERFERLEEQLEIVTGLWTTPVGGSFTFEGAHYSVVDSPALPKPVQSPRPPVIVGGAGAVRTPRLAARFADEFNVPFHTLERGAAQFQRVRAACEDQRRDVSTMTFSVAQTVVCGRDDGAVRRGLEAIGRGPEGVGFCGTPEQVVDALGRWSDAGATRAYLQFLMLDDLDQLRLIGEEVLPRVAA
jgi:F420-dependent oxidoreductase-like protein